MSKSWNGPSDAVRATSTCFLASSLHRRAGRQKISYDIDPAGRRAAVYRVEKRGSDWYRIDLGSVDGADPMNTFINVALQHTEHDSELFTIIAAQLERRTDDVLAILKDRSKQLDVALEDIADCIAWLAYRHGPSDE